SVLGSCCSNPFVEVAEKCLFFGASLSLDYQSSIQTCSLINGQLVKIDQPQQLRDITQYIQNDQTLYSSYWIDGSYLSDDWLYSDGEIIPLGTPFWATFMKDNQEYGQQPVDLPGANCLAIRKEVSYFFTSNICEELYSPLCEEIEATTSVSVSSTTCGGSLTGLIGEITSPNYPGSYPECDCVWTITWEDDSAIGLTLIYYDGYSQIEHNYLEIRDGLYADSHLLGKYYGHDVVTPINLFTSGQHAWVHFWASGNVGYGGFNLTWTTEWRGTCHFEFYSQVGDIQSPWYPEMYPNKVDCSWLITADVESVIYLTTISFHTQKDADIVQIRDGADNNASLISQMSDFVEPGYEVVSTSNQLYISFKSDGTISEKGFAFKWAAKKTCQTPFLRVGRMCLNFIFNDLTFGQSGISCQEESGQLAAITDSQDLRDLYMYLQNQGIGDTSFWLGGSDNHVEGLWKWKDDTLVPRGTPFWGTMGAASDEQEPTGSNAENCLLLDAEGFHYFRDAPCDTKASALCMYLI
ncbi:unnamed protein product, partial [Meganyctiphanes norvegica]